MKILLVASKDSKETLEDVKGLSESSLSKGHEVTVFFNSGSTRLLSSARETDDLPALKRRGVRLLACRTSALEMGLASSGALLAGAEMSSLGELVDLMDTSDRAVFIG